MKFFVNKNLMHNGKVFSKGHQVKESDDGFKELFRVGHISEVKQHEKIEAKPSEKPAKLQEPEKQPKK